MRKTNERYLGELLNPPEKPGRHTAGPQSPGSRKPITACRQPLYCLAFAMIALAAILRGRRQRGALAMRLTVASLAAAALRIAGYGVRGPAASHPALFALFYLIPLLGAGLALAGADGLQSRGADRAPPPCGSGRHELVLDALPLSGAAILAGRGAWSMPLSWCWPFPSILSICSTAPPAMTSPPRS